MKYSLSFLMFLMLSTEFSQANNCSESTNVRLDKKGGTLAGLQPQDQDGLGTCYANAASLLLQAKDPSHRRFSYISMAMTYAQNKIGNQYGIGKYNEKDKRYDFFMEGGDSCEVIQSIQQKKFACSQESMKYEDLSTKNNKDAYEAQYDIFEKVKNLNYLYWHSPNLKNAKLGPKKIISLYEDFIKSKKSEAKNYCLKNNFSLPSLILEDIALDLVDQQNEQAKVIQSSEATLKTSHDKLEIQKNKIKKLEDNLNTKKQALLAEYPQFKSLEELKTWNDKKLSAKIILKKEKHQDLKTKFDQIDADLNVITSEQALLSDYQKEIDQNELKVGQDKIALLELQQKMSKIGEIQNSSAKESDFQDQFTFKSNEQTLASLNERYLDLFKNNKSNEDAIDYKNFFGSFFQELGVSADNLDFTAYNFAIDFNEFNQKSDKDLCEKNYVASIFNQDVDTFKNQLSEYATCNDSDISPHGKLLAELSEILYYLSETHTVDQLSDVVKLMPGNVDLVRAMMGPKCLEGGAIPVPQEKCNRELVSDYLNSNKTNQAAAYTNIESKLNGLLNKGAPIAIGICTEFFNSPFDSKQCTQREEQDGVPRHGTHAVTIIGKDCKNGKTRYLIQNSWGEHHCPDNSQLECVKNRGSFWVDSTILFNNMIDFEYL